MADGKTIPELTDGGILQQGDKLEVSRSGNSRFVVPSAGAFTEGDTVGAASSTADNIPAFADTTGKLLKDSGIAAAIINKALKLDVCNNTGVTIEKGKAVKIIGLLGVVPEIELAKADTINDARTVFGITKDQILDGEEGEVAVFDNISGIDTSMYAPNAILYLSADTAGELTDIPPAPPNYVVSLAFVSLASPTGAIGVRIAGFAESDTSTNSGGILNGIVTQAPQVDFSVVGGVIYADVTNEEDPTAKLPFLIGDDRYLLDTLTGSGTGGAARVVVPPGPDDENLQDSLIYIYLNGGVPTLAAATTEPSIPFAPVAKVSAFDAVRTLAEGENPFKYRRSNDSIDLINGVNDGGIGLLREILNSIREKLGTNWKDGQDITPTVNNTTIRVALTAGEGRQFRKANLPLFDGLNYVIYNNNANNVTWQNSTNLIDISEDASGNNLAANGRYYTIGIYYQINSNGIGNNVIATRPISYYTTSAEAIQDPQGYRTSVNNISIEEVVYPVCDLVIGRTGAGGSTITLEYLRDKRTRLVGSEAGGGAAGGAGADEKVRVSATDTTTDYLDPKITVGDEFIKEITNHGVNESILIKFKAWLFNAARTFKTIINSESITEDRTLTVQDKSYTIADDAEMVKLTGQQTIQNKKNFEVSISTEKNELYAANLQLDLDASNFFRITDVITGDITFTTINAGNTQLFQLEYTMDAIGGHTQTFNPTYFGEFNESVLPSDTANIVNTIVFEVRNDGKAYIINTFTR